MNPDQRRRFMQPRMAPHPAPVPPRHYPR
jgi:hypothetical protein